jgi:hypothetical protein
MRVFDEAVKLCPPRRPFMPVHFVPNAPHAPAHLELPAKPPGTTHEPTQDEDDEGERERHASTRAHSGRARTRTHARTHARTPDESLRATPRRLSVRDRAPRRAAPRRAALLADSPTRYSCLGHRPS